MAWGDKTEVKNAFGITTHVATENWDGSSTVREAGFFSTNSPVANVSQGVFGDVRVSTPSGGSRQVNISYDRAVHDSPRIAAGLSSSTGQGSGRSVSTGTSSPRPTSYEYGNQWVPGINGGHILPYIPDYVQDYARDRSWARAKLIKELGESDDPEALTRFYTEERLEMQRRLQRAEEYRQEQARPWLEHERIKSRDSRIVGGVLSAAVIVLFLWLAWATSVPNYHIEYIGNYGYTVQNE